MAGGGYLDTLSGKNGDDLYIIDSSSTRIQEFYNGDDIGYIYASTFSTSANVETFYMMYGALELTTRSHDNTVFGNKHDNVINGRNGNDTIGGAEGDDTLLGIGSTGDIAIFHGDLADFDITYLGGTTLEVADTSNGGQGVDTVTDFEFLLFNDGIVDALSFYV